MDKKPRIALQIEKNRAHGRSLLEGIANYALAQTEWRLEQIEPQQLTDPKCLARFDGLIVRVMDSRTAAALLASGKPIIDTYGRINDNPLPSIRLGDEAIARMAADCFKEHRFSDVAYCGFCGLRFSDARGEAFKACADEFATSCSVYSDDGKGRLKDTFFRNERADRVTDQTPLKRWLLGLPKPVAVFCCNDLRAYQVLKTCEAYGLDVPRDVAVLGVDNDTLLCTFTNPPLSSIDTDPFALGRAAAAMLADEMSAAPHRTRRTKHETRPTVLHPPRTVVERTSTEIYPFKTPWLSDALIYIRRHCCENVSAADVVRHLGYSHTAVNKAFNAELGTSVQQEIIRLRLERACRLLSETDLTAAAIAAQCGYPSPQYFSHFFVRTFKTTPDAWRKGNVSGRRRSPWRVS